jgi:hypothetical protein
MKCAFFGEKNLDVIKMHGMAIKIQNSCLGAFWYSNYFRNTNCPTSLHGFDGFVS